jgi:hypothetical protein
MGKKRVLKAFLTLQRLKKTILTVSKQLGGDTPLDHKTQISLQINDLTLLSRNNLRLTQDVSFKYPAGHAF